MYRTALIALALMLALFVHARAALAAEENGPSDREGTDDIMEKLDGEADPEKASEDTPRKKLFTLHGLIENEDFLMYQAGLKKKLWFPVNGVPVRQDYNQHLLNKAEFRGMIDITIGEKNLHARGILHGYLYPAGKVTGHLDNRIDPHEAYLFWRAKYTELKAGRHVVRWGSAGFTGVTSFFTPLDLTELVFKGEDELFTGITGPSLKLLLGRVEIQALCAPVPSATTLPGTSSPWGARFPSRRGLTPVLYNGKGPDLSMQASSVSYGGRISVRTDGVNVAFSGYRGMDRDVLLFPRSFPAGQYQVATILEPRWRNLTAAGMDLEVTAGGFRLTLEGCYSMNKNVVSRPIPSRLKPHTIRPVHYAAVAAGVEWSNEGKDFTVSAASSRSFFIVDPGRYTAPTVSNLLSVRLDKKLAGGLVALGVGGLMSTENLSLVITPSAGIHFPFGLSIEAEAGIFSGKKRTVLGSYRGRDLAAARVRYRF